MTSILTNTGAMVALQTLNMINKDLDDVQSQISTGKKVATAADGAAIWAVSSVMESDVGGFAAISESLSLGKASVAVARNGSEKITELLNEVKSKIVAAQEDNVDRGKVQTDIDELRTQIGAIVDAAQFNGLNLLKGTEDVEILSSLDRSSTGVATSKITVQRQDLTTDAGSFGSDGALSNITVTTGGGTIVNTANTEAVTIGGTIAATETFSVTIAGQELSYTTTGTTTAEVVSGLAGVINTAGIEGITATATNATTLTLNSTNKFEEFEVTVAEASAAGTIAAADGTLERRAETVTLGSGHVAEGDSYRLTIDGQNYDYVAGKNEDMNDVALGLKGVVDASVGSDITLQVNAAENPFTTNVTLFVDNDGTGVALAASDNSGGTATGGLNALGGVDVSTAKGAERALDNIENLIQSAIDASAQFGSYESRVDIQQDFVSSLIDSLNTGIGALVDTNMEKASARLQALQVQQQLGTQALSIANSAPQNVLSLFR